MSHASRTVIDESEKFYCIDILASVLHTAGVSLGVGVLIVQFQILSLSGTESPALFILCSCLQGSACFLYWTRNDWIHSYARAVLDIEKIICTTSVIICSENEGHCSE